MEVRRWWRYATEDLASAKTLARSSEGAPRQSCWLAQQAAEKALKALLVGRGIDFPRTHDLDVLRNLLPADCRPKSEPADLAELTEWAIEARYPGDWLEATAADAARAVATAEVIVDGAREELARFGEP